MNRNINKSIELVFDIVKLKFDLSSTSVLPTDFYNKRVVKGDPNEEEWLKRCEITHSIEITHEIRFVLIRFKETNYFIAIGNNAPSNVPDGLNLITINAGLFVALVSDLELPVKSNITNLYLEQNILSQSSADSLYTGHELSELLPIFPNIYGFKITREYIGDENNLNQLICVYLTSNKSLITLPFSLETLDSIKNLVLINSRIISYESVVQSLLSSNFKFAFLDLYRCIELLYQIIYVDSAYIHLGLTIDKNQFLQAIVSKLNWKIIEKQSIEKLFSETPDSDKNEIVKSVRNIDNQIKSISNWVYDLRCNIVHLRSAQTEVKLKQNDWDKIISGIVKILIHWYQKYLTF